MKRMSLLAAASAAALSLAACGQPETTETDVADGTAAMPVEEPMPADPMTTDTAAASGTIVGVAQGSPTFSTLVSAVTAADLGTTLSGAGPYTVFAPTNAAFEKIPQATRDTLMAPAGKADLASILRNHVVSGRVTAADLAERIREGNGTASLTTIGGGRLTARMDGSNVVLTDAKGGRSTVTATDTSATNGMIHTIDTVLMPA